MAGFVSVSGLCKKYDDTWAVDNIDFEIEEGKFLVLLGPSGCGKTTTLRCIGGLERPQGGKILIDGREVTNASQGVFLQPEARGMGMVAQSYAIWPHMSVFENVAFPLRMRNEQRDQIASRVNEALEVVRLGGLGERNATDLSGGQQQRIALARAIVGRPKVLLFDEPLSNLDAMLREQMRHLIKDIQREMNVTAVYVTHDQSEAMGLGDELIVMNQGRIEQRGQARELYCQPSTCFVAEFIGVANMLEGDVVDNSPSNEGKIRVQLGADENAPVVECLMGAASTTQRVAIMVRPEWLTVLHGHPNKAENVILGTVHKLEYLGERTEMVISTEQGFLRTISSGVSTFAEGEPVHLVIDSNMAISLPL